MGESGAERGAMWQNGDISIFMSYSYSYNDHTDLKT